jgi:hypothetical protein
MKNMTVLIKFASAIFIPQFLSLRFDLPTNYRGTPVDPSRHTSVPRHTCGPCVTPLCRSTPADPSRHTSVP